MLVGITGSLSSGRREVAAYFCQNKGFQLLRISEREQTRPSLSSDPPNQDADIFSSADDLLDYATGNWRKDFAVLIDSKALLDILKRRPFFVHLHLDAPLLTRWQRRDENVSLKQFVELNDVVNFHCGLYNASRSAHITLVNIFKTIPELHTALDALNILNQERVRPSWDSYFMHLADLAALRSNCMKRRVGCVLVRDRRIISTGYNGTPRGLVNCNDGGCSRCNSGTAQGASLITCLCLHAEENALLEAGRDRVGREATIYCNTCPCLTCSIKIVQTGISEVVYSQAYSMDSESAKVFQSAGVRLRQYVAPPCHLS